MLTEAKEALLNKQKFAEQLSNSVNINTTVILGYNSNDKLRKQLYQVLFQYVTQTDNKTTLEASRLVLKYIKAYKNKKQIPAAVLETILFYIRNVAPKDQVVVADMNKLIDLIDKHLPHGNVVMVTHSQGNFYGNSIFNDFNLRSNNNAKAFLRMVSIGTPANSVANGGKWFTNTKDLVMNAVRLGPYGALPANYSFPQGDFLGHGFIETYLNPSNYHARSILEQIEYEHNDMNQDELNSCKSIVKTGGGYENFQYLPTEGVWEGYIKVTFESYDAQNQFTIEDRFGVSLYSTGFFSGQRNLSFYYRSEIHGELRVAVRAERPTADAWSIRFQCVGDIPALPIPPSSEPPILRGPFDPRVN